MTTRYSIFRNGYINEDGSMIEPKRVASGNVEKSALNRAKITENNKHDYHCVKEQFDGVYWVSIEGSEIHF